MQDLANGGVRDAQIYDPQDSSVGGMTSAGREVAHNGVVSVIAC